MKKNPNSCVINAVVSFGLLSSFFSCKTRGFNAAESNEAPLDANNIVSIDTSLDNARREFFSEEPFYLKGNLSELELARQKAAVRNLAETFQSQIVASEKKFGLPINKANEQRRIAQDTKTNMTPYLKKLHAKAMYDCSNGNGSCAIQSTESGVWKEIYTTDLIPQPPAINRNQVFQYISDKRNLKFIDGFPRFSGSTESSDLENDYKRYCQRNIKGDRDDKDFYLWHTAEAKNPFKPDQDLTFFLGALGNSVKGKFAGFTYCVAAILDGTMGPTDEIIDYVKALNALGPKQLKERQEFEINGVKRVIQPAPNLTDVLIKLGLPQRFAEKVNFPSPLGLNAGVKDLYFDNDFKISVGVDLRQPNDKKLWIFDATARAGETEFAKLTATKKSSLRLIQLEESTGNNKELPTDLCEINAGETIKVSSLSSSRSGINFYRIKLLGDLKCPQMGRHVFAKVEDFSVTKTVL